MLGGLEITEERDCRRAIVHAVLPPDYQPHGARYYPSKAYVQWLRTAGETRLAFRGSMSEDPAAHVPGAQ